MGGVIIESRPPHVPSAWRAMREHDRQMKLVAHRSERLASDYRTARHARLKIVEDALERRLTPGVRDAAIRERQRLIHFLEKG